MSTYGELTPSPRILMGPGPSDVHPRVLRAMSTPLVGHLDPEFLVIMNETQDLLRQVFQTKNALTFAVSGTGSAGMETCVVNLIEPGTLYADRRTNVDFRVSKILRYGRTRTQFGVDFYNLTNTDVVTTYNQTFVPGGAWLTPTAIQPARYMKLNVQVDF